jgi:hypothetical protein
VSPRAPLPSIAPAASQQEAAAIVAALERFVRDTAAPARSAPRIAPPAGGGWLRAARAEAVHREPETPAPWGDSALWRAAAGASFSNP